MLVEYPCAMQRRNTYQRRQGNVLKCIFAIAIVLQIYHNGVTTAPASYDTSLPQSSEIAEYFSDIAGCYYNFQRYEESDRIVTNEPCLNCTCHNRMLMCYLRVCPFTKAIGQDCTIEKKPDQCCPIITCPEVPVKLLTSSTTSSPTSTTPITELGFRDNYGCTIDNSFYADGAQVPSDPRKPCELCYCIRNRTACVMQECTLHVEGCKPVYQDGICCPVRYDCDYDKEGTSTSRTHTSGANVVKSTTYASVVDCHFGNQTYADGELITTEKPCEHCYCMRGDIVCAVQDCGEPLRGKDCVPTMPPPELCCPNSYDCTNDTSSGEDATKTSELYNTTPPNLSFTSEAFSSHNPTILSQEEIYEKLGEHAPSSTFNSISTSHTSTTVSLQDTTTINPSENIRPNNAINITERVDTTSQEKEKIALSSFATESIITTIREVLFSEYTTDKPSSRVPDVTTVKDETTTETINNGSVRTTERVVANDLQLSSQNENQIYEITKFSYTTTKFESNEIGDEGVEVIDNNPNAVFIDRKSTERPSKTTFYPHSSEGVNELYSSEVNHHTVTTWDVDSSTTALKEHEESATTPRLTPTTSPEQNDEVTEFNTVSEKNTEPRPGSYETEKAASDRITEEAVTVASGVPGEGSCLVDGITYPNTSIIESSNPCHTKCVCLSSIPTCTLVSCQPPPNDPKCMPVQIKPESCCPAYVCNGDEHEQIPSVQILGHNQVAADENDHHEEQISPEQNSNHISQVTEAVLVSSSALGKQPDAGNTEMPSSTLTPEKEIIVATDSSTDAIEPIRPHESSALDDTETPPPQTQKHEYQPTTTDAPSSATTPTYVQFEVSSRLPVVVSEFPETSTDAAQSIQNEEPPATEKLGTVAPHDQDKNTEIYSTIPMDPTESNIPSSFSPEYSQNDKLVNASPPIRPTQIIAEVVTDEPATEQAYVTSEPVTWIDKDSEAQDHSQHPTFSPSSTSSEYSETTTGIADPSLSSIKISHTDLSSTTSFPIEDIQTTLVPEVAAESVSTEREQSPPVYVTTNKPEDNEFQTTIREEYEITSVDAEASNLPDTETNTAQADKELAKFSTLAPPVEQSNELSSTVLPTYRPLEPIVTTMQAEILPDSTTLSESTYTKEVYHSISPSNTEYTEMKTPPPPPPPSSSSVSESVSNVPTTMASVSDSIITTVSSETNEIGSQEASKVTSSSAVSQDTTKSPSTSDTSATYSPIQHSTWAPKPIDNSEEKNSTEANPYPQAPMYPTGSVDSNGIINGPDNISMEEYDEEPNAFGSGTCRYGGKLYVSAQQIPRDDPCDFCFCFRSDIICLQQSCPPPIHGCRQEPIQGFCCPRYECPVARDISPNATVHTTTSQITTTTVHPTRPERISHDSHGSSARKTGCVINGYFYNVGDDIAIASGPCLECICGSDGRMKCDPKSCSPEPYVRQMMAESTYRR